MTIEKIEQKFNELEGEIKEVSNVIEQDAHMEFIESLKQLVNKY